jgi:FkbM family methyltransferase
MSALPKALRELRYRLFYGLVLDKKCELRTLGAPDSICKWTIAPNGLGAKSIVYSGGIGSDITFEHALVQQFGCDVVLMDPSPTGLKTMALPENKIPQFHFFPVALAGHEGALSLGPPLDPTGDSWFARTGSNGTVQVPCTDLPALMKKNRHQQIDLLKLDIEGSEYEVIDQLIAQRLPVKQICVEFHHGILPGIRRSQTIRAMIKLMARGYKLVDQSGANHTFVNRRRWN